MEEDKRYFCEEDEIDLYELFLVFSRRKKLILGTVLTTVVLTSLLVFIITPKYKIGMCIRPGVTGFNDKGLPISDWKPTDFKTWIENKPYEEKLKSKYGIHLPEVNITIPRNSSLLTLTIYYSSPDKGQQMLMDIVNFFLQENLSSKNNKITSEKLLLRRKIEEAKRTLSLVDIEKQEINAQIAYLESKITAKKKEINFLKENIKALELSKKDLTERINSINKNTEELIRLRNQVLTNMSNKEALSLLMYSNIIQNNIVYVSNLEQRLLEINKQINARQKLIEDKKLEIENIKKEIKTLELKRDKKLEKKRFDIQNTIKELEIKLNMLNPLEIVQSPYSSIKPVKPKKLLIITIAGITALFFGIFLAFFLEWLEKIKQGDNHRG